MEKANRPARRVQLHAIIIARGYSSAADFSKKIHCAQSTISAIICGWRYPGRGLQTRIADALGITLGDLGKFLKG